MYLIRKTWSTAVAAAALALCLPLAAQADTLDFESLAPNFYLQGDSFQQAGYVFTVNGDIGLIDSATSCAVAACPLGNDSSFYQGLNDGHLLLQRTDGSVFTLQGFDAGFMSAMPLPALSDVGELRVKAVDADGNVFRSGFSFGVSSTGGFVFNSYSGAAFSKFAGITSADFYACTFNIDGDCVNSNINFSQFALDNVQVVPEPASALLLLLGLAGLVALRRPSLLHGSRSST